MNTPYSILKLVGLFGEEIYIKECLNKTKLKFKVSYMLIVV